MLAQQFHHGTQSLVVAAAAVVAQAFSAQLRHGLVQCLQALVHHGLRVQLQVAARLKVHAQQGLVKGFDAVQNVTDLGFDALEQGAHALV